ncbi:hypothetical protein D9Q98_001596 [Chlorella vulgaris]|uniref:rRNA biogenesis protein RRP36 n=1 Tax=Chlorella vulgaris TaxID=3077 RepID=A0A9D4TV86_CHLVU|nr:hypothetical protein D9Q98_001596 [Chlorella vulgaris]
MKRERAALQRPSTAPAVENVREPPRRRRHAANDGSDDDAPEQVAFVAKRPRQTGLQHVDGGSSSESEGDSGDSQSDTSSSSDDEQPGAKHEEEDEGLPLGQLVQLRQDGSTSTAAMKSRARALRQQGRSGSFKREGKHRPAEMSSKKPVPVFRDAMQAGKRDIRDPRFESLSSGQYNEEKFKKRYAFLYDEKLPAERDELRAALARAKGQGRREELQVKLSRVEQQLRSEEARRKREGFKKQVKAKERGAVRDGKQPFYLKKSEQRRLELLAKYEELKAGGKLEAYLAKRRKRNAAKDHRHLPGDRRTQQQGGSE